jgi:CheY-like chemotaxis protein
MTTVTDTHREPKSLRVLLAEDDLVHQKLALALLTMRGHSVTIACNGEEAVDALKDGDFDVVLMDIEMPVMDGIQATHLIRERENTNGKRIPVIAVTATVDPHRCLAAGMDGWIAKPLTADEIDATMHGMLSNTSRQSGRDHLPRLQEQVVGSPNDLVSN